MGFVIPGRGLRMQFPKREDIDRSQKPANVAIIGGQFVDPTGQTDYSAVNAGIDRRNAFDADYKARAKSQAVFGSPDFSRGFVEQVNRDIAGKTFGANPNNGFRSAPNADLLPTSASSTLDELTGLPDGAGQALSEAQDALRQPSAAAGNPAPARRTPQITTDSGYYGDSRRESRLRGPSGYANGGMVDTQKMKTVNQPGSGNIGKVKMPDNSGYVPPTNMAEIEAEHARMKAAHSAPAAAPSASGPHIPGYKWGPPAPRDGYRWDDERGYMCGGKVRKKGMMSGGPIGDAGEDDGKDSVDVRVREGEYLLNPPTVAKAFGGGDYDAGVENLNQIVRETTGKEPGPMPVNEDGEAVRQGFRNGGAKMGFAAGGSFAVMPDGSRVYYTTPGGEGIDTGEASRAGRARADAARNAPTQPPPETRVVDRSAEAPRNRGMRGVRQSLNGKHTTTVGDVVRGTGRGVKSAAQKVGGAAGMLRGAAPVAGLMGAWQGLQTPTEDYAARMGVDYPETFAGELGVRTAGVLSDVGTAFVDPFIELGNLATGGDVPTLRSKFADVEAAGGTGASLPAQMAGAEAIAPPAPGQAGAPVDTRPAYGRAFGRGNTDGLRHPDTTYSAAMPVPQGVARVVQRTGGPGDEVIVREDVNGVPTFTNLRRGGFDGSAANLQKEADARVREDSIRERQQLALQRERAISSDPQAAATFEKAKVDSAGRNTGKPQDLRKELEQQFQIPVMDSDGNVKKHIPDPEAIQEFEGVIAQLNPEIMAQYGAPFHELPFEIRQQVYATIQPVLNDTRVARRAQQAEGYPTSNVPRTGANSLRVLPGSDISFWGDTVFGNASFGDYWAGAFDSNPINDRMVTDPLSNNTTRIPLRQLLRMNNEDEQEALRRYGYFDAERQ